MVFYFFYNTLLLKDHIFAIFPVVPVRQKSLLRNNAIFHYIQLIVKVHFYCYKFQNRILTSLHLRPSLEKILVFEMGFYTTLKVEK